MDGDDEKSTAERTKSGAYLMAKRDGPVIRPPPRSETLMASSGDAKVRSNVGGNVNKVNKRETSNNNDRRVRSRDRDFVSIFPRDISY